MLTGRNANNLKPELYKSGIDIFMRLGSSVTERVSDFLFAIDVDLTDTSVDTLTIQVKIAIALRELLAQMIQTSNPERAAELREVSVVNGFVDFAPLKDEEVNQLGRFFMGPTFAVVDTLSSMATSADIVGLTASIPVESIDAAESAITNIMTGFFDASKRDAVVDSSKTVLRLEGHYTIKATEANPGYVVGHGLCGTAALSALFVQSKGLAPITTAQLAAAYGHSFTEADRYPANDKSSHSSKVQLIRAVCQLKTSINADSRFSSDVKRKLTGAVDRQCQAKISEVLASSPVQGVDLLLAQCEVVEKTFAKTLGREIESVGGVDAFIAQQALLLRASAPVIRAPVTTATFASHAIAADVLPVVESVVSAAG